MARKPLITIEEIDRTLFYVLRETEKRHAQIPEGPEKEYLAERLQGMRLATEGLTDPDAN